MLSKKILLSFVGTNDAGKLIDQPDGAILTALKNEKFDEVILLWNESKVGSHSYTEILSYLKKEITRKKLANKVSDILLTFTDVTDHNDIYNKLKELTGNLPKSKNLHYTAAISSGTPSMQVCWILLAESGDFSEEFPLRLIKVKDPKFGKSGNIEVKLDTSLPKILRLKNEIDTIKKDLIPTALINIDRGELTIGKTKVDLSPIEFCNYRYFAERVIDGLGDEKFSGVSVSLSFMESIFSFHEESFPNLDLNREDLRKMIKNGNELGITTFRGNISKINKKMKETLDNPTLVENFQISKEGKRGAKFYGIKVAPSKIKIVD